MPAFKDEQRNTWYSKFYYVDYTGVRKQKMKRGFARKKDADQWEKDFLAKVAGSPAMPFVEMCDLFLEDKKAHVKLVTYETQKQRLEQWIIPYFKDKPLNEITPADVRKWQTEIKQAEGARGRRLSPAYMHSIFAVMSNVFNYAVRFHGLTTNPCRVAGNTIGKKTKNIKFWTKDQFDAFINTFDRSDPYRAAYLTLYYTGMRIGELMALTVADVDTEAGLIHVNKTYHRVDGKTIVTAPKTARSIRDIVIPRFLADCLADQIGRLYKPRPGDRIFLTSKVTYFTHLKEHTKTAGLPEIRLHDLRHSHASLLIELGCSALLVSERLGHENVSTTLDVYSHLFPSKQSEVADRLENLCKDNNY